MGASCLAVYKVPVHILWYSAAAQTLYPAQNLMRKSDTNYNSISSSLLKAERQIQANLFCWHNKLQTPGLLFPNQKPNQILLVNMTWLLTGPERKHFSPPVSQARTLLASLPKSRHWQVVVQPCCLVLLGWGFVTSEIKGKTGHEWGKIPASTMLVERQGDLPWHSELHWASPTSVPMPDGAASFPPRALSERGVCWSSACSSNHPLPWAKPVAASPASGSCSQMCFCHYRIL